MSAASKLHARPLPAAPWGDLPPRMRVLYVGTPERNGRWLAEALSCDSASEVILEEALGFAEGLAILREQVFDAVLVSHEPGQLDALEFAEGFRAGGSEEPLIVLGSEPPGQFDTLCFEVGADAYVGLPGATTRGMLWTVARAIERQTLIRENRRLAQAERHRLQLEQREAERLLSEQRALVGSMDDGASGAARLPDPLCNHYRDLLRAHVMMGSGNLGAELARLAELLASAKVSAPQTLDLHVGVLGELIRGLGSRSARHVMTRADLLAMELLVQLGEQYRQAHFEAVHPPSQRYLPGFETVPAGER